MPRRRVRVALAATALSTVVPAALVLGSSTASHGDVQPLGYDAASAKGSLWQIREAVQANAMSKAGFTGKGIGVALIDTGVTEVRGLDTGNVFHGPDLSFDSQDPELVHKDAFGHGTHLASIIAGRDAVGTPASYTSQSAFYGIAPDVNLVSVKVGANDGAVDVTQVIAGIDWVVEHRNDNGLNIKVIALAYGTGSTQDPRIDPLTYAVEQAWKAGITVVVAGGNDGKDTMLLADPAQSPYVLAVGADDTKGTVAPGDDSVPAWASRGTNSRHVDVVAPGVSVMGARINNGYADQRNPLARVGTRFAKASGTSQATAVVAGEVALLLQARPTLTPDQVKQQFQATAFPFAAVDNKYRGNGLTRVNDARLKDPTNAKQSSMFWSSGTGSIDAARGGSYVNDGIVPLMGEKDIFGRPWNAATWTKQSAAGTAWQGGLWLGNPWAGNAWDGRVWLGTDWTAGTWSARSWRDSEWAARSWRDNSWTGSDWTARSWRDALWSARSWRSADLASASWQSATWR